MQRGLSGGCDRWPWSGMQWRWRMICPRVSHLLTRRRSPGPAWSLEFPPADVHQRAVAAEDAAHLLSPGNGTVWIDTAQLHEVLRDLNSPVGRYPAAGALDRLVSRGVPPMSLTLSRRQF